MVLWKFWQERKWKRKFINAMKRIFTVKNEMRRWKMQESEKIFSASRENAASSTVNRDRWNVWGWEIMEMFFIILTDAKVCWKEVESFEVCSFFADVLYALWEQKKGSFKHFGEWFIILPAKKDVNATVFFLREAEYAGGLWKKWNKRNHQCG